MNDFLTLMAVLAIACLPLLPALIMLHKKRTRMPTDQEIEARETARAFQATIKGQLRK